MTENLVQLTLVAPRDQEEHLVEILLEHDEAALTGFTTREINAFGSHVLFRDIAEQIRGRVRRVEFKMLLPASEAHDLVGHLRKTVSGRGVSFYIGPVEAAGDIG